MRHRYIAARHSTCALMFALLTGVFLVTCVYSVRIALSSCDRPEEKEYAASVLRAICGDLCLHSK